MKRKNWKTNVFEKCFIRRVCLVPPTTVKIEIGDPIAFCLFIWIFTSLQLHNIRVIGLGGVKGGGESDEGNRLNLRRYRTVFSIVLRSFLRAADRSEGIEREWRNEVRSGQAKRWSAERFSSWRLGHSGGKRLFKRYEWVKQICPIRKRAILISSYTYFFYEKLAMEEVLF